MLFTVKLANNYIEIQSHTPELIDFFKDYVVTGVEPDFGVSWTKEEILAEQDLCQTTFSLSYLETLVALRKIAEILPSKNSVLFHGASISYQDKAYLFTAPSGTGKSTHIRLWRKYLGEDVKIVNGDKPFISLNEEKPHIFGTPWAGKERWQRNCSKPLEAICVVRRGLKNTIRKIDPVESLNMLFQQIYMPQDMHAAERTLELLDSLLIRVPVYLLECDMSEDAVRCSFEELTKSPYRPVI